MRVVIGVTPANVSKPELIAFRTLNLIPPNYIIYMVI